MARIKNIKSTVLWKAQYAPRERAIKNTLEGADLRRWNAMPIHRKIAIIDSMEAKGAFK